MSTHIHRIAARQAASAVPRSAHRLAWLLLITLLALAAVASRPPASTTGGGAALTAVDLASRPGAAPALVVTAGFTRHGGADHHPAARRPAAAGLITLVPGDTLLGLASRYHTTVPTLQELNGLGTSTLIYAGAAFRIPAAHPGADLPRNAPPTPVASGAAARAVAFARVQLGKPYVWGGTGPRGYDCSGLVMRAWQAAGVQLPRVTYEQVNAGRRITRGQLVPGDLIFSNSYGHVQLYLGGGQVIQAPHTGAVIDIVSLPPASLVDAYVHISPPATTIQSP